MQLSIDAIDDLRLAVDEAVAFLLTTDRSASRVEIRLDPTDATLTATIGMDSTIERWPPDGYQETLPWQVILGLTEGVTVTRSEEGLPADPVREADGRCATRMTMPPDDRQVDEADVLRLFERIPHDDTARDELVAKFQPLAEYFARRFTGRGEPIEDLTQVANIGLLSAIDRFDPIPRGPFHHVCGSDDPRRAEATTSETRHGPSGCPVPCRSWGCG